MDGVNYMFVDFETRSRLDIRKVGGARYVRDCEPLLMGWALDDGPVQVHDFLQDGMLPTQLADILEDPATTIIAHNVAFDRGVMEHALRIPAPVVRWFDTSALALTLGLPAGLGPLGEALGFEKDAQKNKDGRKYIQMFSKPRRLKGQGTVYFGPEDRPEDWAKFIEYCRQDVQVMRALYRQLPRWNYRTGSNEHMIWAHDQHVNDRGLPIDVETCGKIISALEAEVSRLDDRIQALTKGAVTSARKVRDLIQWLNQVGVRTDSVDKAAIAKLLDGNHRPRIQEALEIRSQVSKSSTAKYKTMLQAQVDGRVRGCFQYYGASRTGRWAGRLVQFQNLPRGSLSRQEAAVAAGAFKAGIADLAYDNLMDVASSTIRSMIQAPPGYKLVVSDLSNIEGRVLAWLADENWKLDAFRNYDAGVGHDPYVLTYSRSFGVPVGHVGSAERQIGKVEELALGYQGGVGAFSSMARLYGIDLEQAYASVWSLADDVCKQNATSLWEWAVEQSKTFDLTMHEFLAADVVKQLWRQAHNNTCRLWYDCERWARQAIESPGATYGTDKIQFRLRRSHGRTWLTVSLPNARMLTYYNPRVDEAGKLYYWGVYQPPGGGARGWMQIGTYGGKLVENITQAVARDVLAHSLGRIEAAGYRVIGTVHDEVITEVSTDVACADYALSHILAENPSWAAGLPLSAAGYEAERYGKG